MKCIFCLLDRADDQFTIEHVFPDAIGGTLELHNSVCKDCNSFLGSNVDVCLTDHYLIQFRRFFYRLSGKSGKVPNPLENGTLLESHDQKIKYYFDENGKPKELYLVPSINKDKISDNATKVAVSIDSKDLNKLPDILNKIINRSGLDKTINAEDLLSQLRVEEVATPKIRVNAGIDIINYQKAILKIAYELAYYWLGTSYLNDPLATSIRSAIMDRSDPSNWGAKYKIRGNIGMFQGAILPVGTTLQTSHIAFLNQSQNILACYVRIFTVFEGIIAVTENAHLYQTITDSFIEINSVTGSKKESSLVDGLAYLSSKEN